MMKRMVHSPVFRVIFIDLLLLNLINVYFVITVKGYNFRLSTRSGERYLPLLILLNLLWIVVNLVMTRYRMEPHRPASQEIKKIFVNMILFTGIVSIFAFGFKEMLYSRLIIYGTLLAFGVAVFAAHLFIYMIFKVWRKKQAMPESTLIVGNDSSAIFLARQLTQSRDIQYDVTVYLDGPQGEETGQYNVVTGKLDGASAFLSDRKVDELFIVVTSPSEDVIRDLVEVADYHGARVHMVPTFYKLFGQDFEIDHLGNIPVINLNQFPLDYYYNSVYKRVFDLVFSFTVLVLLSPFLAAIALLVKVTSRGPVVYVPQRVGMGGNVFNTLKFRTMYHSVEETDNREVSTRPNDTRITPLGKFLRKFSLDELPQFVNVLKGDMSVVGPRPHRVYLDKVLQDSVDKYMQRHYIKPGVTGWAQVNGWRGPTETEEQKVQRTRHDLWYIRNWSLWLDIKIIFLTLFGKKTRKNAF